MENQTITMYQDKNLNAEFIKRLNSFFSSVDSSQFRNTLIEIYHNYIIHEHQAFPIEFDRMSTQMYIFIDLLGRVKAYDDEPMDD